MYIKLSLLYNTFVHNTRKNDVEYKNYIIFSDVYRLKTCCSKMLHPLLLQSGICYDIIVVAKNEKENEEYYIFMVSDTG